MVKFLLISVLIFVSTSSTTAESTSSSFVSCNKTNTPNYEVCKPTQNSSVLVGVFKAVENASWIIDDTLEYVTPTDLYIYPADNSSCTTPATIEMPQGSFNDLTGLRYLRMECTQFQGSLNPFRNRYSLTTLILSNNKLTNFPRDFCAEIPFLKSLAVQHQQIKILSPDSFTGIALTLEDLNLEDIQLEIIKPETFTRFLNLKTLDLRRNCLQLLRPDMFDGLDHLNALHLGNNRIRLMKPGTFASLTHLQKLFLEMNSLVKVPARIFSDLKKLEVLTLNGNAISTDSFTLIEGLDKLRVVYWGSNKTTKIDLKTPSFLRIILSFSPLNWLESKFTP